MVFVAGVEPDDHSHELVEIISVGGIDMFVFGDGVGEPTGHIHILPIVSDERRLCSESGYPGD